MNKKKKLRCYDVTIDSDVYNVSLVESPAVESNFIFLSEQKPIQICLDKDDKHLIYGAVLIPDFPIYRFMDGEEFYIQFSKETIEKLAHSFLGNGRVQNFTLQHEIDADGIEVVESWIKLSENDKSVDLGLDVPVGSWIMGSHVSNEEVWKAIKAGEMKGYSIEAIVGLEEINNIIINQNNMAKNTNLEAVEITDSFWDKLRSILAEALGKPEKSEEVEETVGEIVDAMEDGAGEKDSEVKVVEQEEETPAEEVVEEIVEDVIEVIEETTETPEEAAEDLQAVVDALREEIAAKDAEIEELKKANAKLSKQPSAKPVVKAAAQKENPRDIIEKLHAGTYFKK